MSKDTCKVLVQQIELLKEYQKGLRELIGVLSDLAARRATIANVSAYVRNVSYGILAVAAAIAGIAGLLGKVLIGKWLTALGGLTGAGPWAAEHSVGGGDFLDDKDYGTVQEMIEEAHREFLAAERGVRKLHREYNELGCQAKYGNAP